MYSTAIHDAYQAAIDEDIATLFRTMLATEIAHSSQEPPTKNLVTALVGFAGNWSGALEFECGREQALVFARRFMQMDDLTEFNEDVRDTVGELANVIAGNLKSILPAGVTISPPSVIEGSDYKVRVRGEKVVGSTTFSTDAGCFVVRLIEASS